MQQLSKVLAAIDEQGEIIKTQIKRLENKDRERKDAAAMVFLSDSGCQDFLEKLIKKYKMTLSSKNPKLMSEEDIRKINTVIDKCRNDKEVSKRELCFFAAWIAIHQKDLKQEELALMLAEEFVDKEPQSPEAEDTRAFLFWVFNRFKKAVIGGEEALRKAEQIPDIKKVRLDFFKCNLCYWVAEAVLANISINREIINKAKIFSKYLLTNYPNEPAVLDTSGFLEISLGKTVKQIENGLNLIHRARENALKSKDKDTIQCTQTFSHRHEGLAYDRIAKMFFR